MGSGWTAVYEAFRGEVEFEAGDLTAAEAAHRRSYEILDQRGQEGFKSTARCPCATAAAGSRALASETVDRTHAKLLCVEARFGLNSTSRFQTGIASTKRR